MTTCISRFLVHAKCWDHFPEPEFENKDVLAFIVHQMGAYHLIERSVNMISLCGNENMIYNLWERHLRRSASLFFLSSTSRYLKMAHLCKKKKIFFTSEPCLHMCYELSTFVVKVGMCNRGTIFFSCFALALVCWYIVYLELHLSSFFFFLNELFTKLTTVCLLQ